MVAVFRMSRLPVNRNLLSFGGTCRSQVPAFPNFERLTMAFCARCFARFAFTVCCSDFMPLPTSVTSLSEVRDILDLLRARRRGEAARASLPARPAPLRLHVHFGVANAAH